MFAALVALFFLSGVSALIYQVLWLRLLALVFGVTVYAATSVLASFMAGLALGSWLGGRAAERSRAPLLIFGVVEIAIGILALASQFLLAALTPVYIALQTQLPDAVLVQSLARFAGSFIVLIGVTTLMGTTLPLIVKAATTGAANVGQRISVLYATNTAGAVTGALLAGFYLVGAHGISASFRVAAACNVIAGVSALLLARTRANVTTGERVAARADVPGSTRLARIGVVVFALSGFASLALEVIWFRVLVYFVPATTYAFSTMLASVLLGLALGSYAAAPLVKRFERLIPRLALLQLATALVIPLSGILLVRTYRLGWHANASVSVSALLAFLPAFFMGMSYPVGLRAWAASAAGDSLDARRIGNLNSANLIGAILGAIAGGFVVLPLFGTQRGVAILAGVYLISFLLLARAFARRARLVTLVAGFALFALAAANVPNLVDAVTDVRYAAGEKLFWWKEGAQTTAAVRMRPSGRRFLYLDGLHQASDGRDVVVMHRMIGHLPMALHPAPARSIVVGLGGGVTPGAVSQHNTQVDVVELSAAVVESARWFSHVNYNVLEQPNVRIRVDDGRNFLLSRAGAYDVLTADLIQPEHAGAGNLYSREYFTLVRRALAPGGLALQWIGRRADNEYKLILRTFMEIFPQTTLWADGHLLVGSIEPLVIQREAFERQLQHQPTREALADVHLDSFENLLKLYVAGPEELRAFAGDGPVLTDDRPMVEYFRSLPEEGKREVDLAPLRGDVRRHLR